jgi:hypothetical protein
MDASDFKKMAEQIVNEIASLEIQQEETERRIAHMKQVLIDLSPLAYESVLPLSDMTTIDTEADGMSVTDATRQILQDAQVPLAPVEIRQRLFDMGMDLNDQRNAMAGIHSLLQRLVASGEIETRDNGSTYNWKGIRVLLSTSAVRPGSIESRKSKRE